MVCVVPLLTVFSIRSTHSARGRLVMSALSPLLGLAFLAALAGSESTLASEISEEDSGIGFLLVLT